MRIQYRLATLFLPIVFCAALCRILFVQPSVPRLFTQPDFDTTDLIDAVNHYVRLGEARSTNQLKELAENHQSTEFNVRERIRWVSRILYLKQDGVPAMYFPDMPLAEAPSAGMPWLSISSDEWPIYPLAKQGKSYFVLYERNKPPRNMENLENYLSMCRQFYVFRTELVDKPTAPSQDADAFFLSDRWTNLKWTDSAPGTYYNFELFGRRLVEFVRQQVPNRTGERN